MNRWFSGTSLAAMFVIAAATGCDKGTTVTPPSIDTTQLREVGENNESDGGRGRSDGSSEAPVETGSDSVPN